MKIKSNETGRSMVETLGVLAVIGVLSVGGIMGYRYAMNKYQANQTLNELNIASSQLAAIILGRKGNDVSLSLPEEYENGNMLHSPYQFDYGCGWEVNSSKTCLLDETAYYMAIKNVPLDDCTLLIPMVSNMQYLIDYTTGDITQDSVFTCADQNNITLFFDTDEDKLYTSDEADTDNPPVDCGVNGTWNSRLDKCQCLNGYTGSKCDKTIKEICLENGNSWNDYLGYCHCFTGGGKDCSDGYNSVCNNHGYWPGCGFGCYCENGWGGIYCDKEITSDKYCNNGTWSGAYDGYCICNPGYAGKNCTELDKCIHGNWINTLWSGSYCKCQPNWGGIDCSKPVSTACGTHGTWIANSEGGYCQCDTEYAGVDCSDKLSDKCKNNSTWENYMYGGASYCHCATGFAGEDCGKTEEEVCNGKGKWINTVSGGRCQCESPYTGDDCSLTCQYGMTGLAGKCTCDSGWAGEDCSIREEEYCKNGFWQSDLAYCLCETGWGGENCDIFIGEPIVEETNQTNEITGV